MRKRGRPIKTGKGPRRPIRPKAASAFFQQDRPGSSMSQAGSPPKRRAPPPAASLLHLRTLTLRYGPTVLTVHNGRSRRSLL